MSSAIWYPAVLAVCFLLAPTHARFAGPAPRVGVRPPPAGVDDTVVANVGKLWNAMTKLDALAFHALVPGGAVFVDQDGVEVIPATRDEIARMFREWCVGKSHTLSELKPTHIDRDNTVVTYTGLIDETCPNGKSGPIKYFMSDLYTRRDGRWVLTLHTESPAYKRTTSRAALSGHASSPNATAGSRP